MKNIAVICEYNPFHNGHILQTEYIRSAFSEPVRIIALMSGNFVERGDLAAADKYKRAEFAICGGVDLVLGLPFPYSLSGAQEYAKKNIEYLNFLPDVDFLCFGSESGDLSYLTRAANRLCSPGFETSMAESAKSGFSLPYAAKRASLYAEKYGEELPARPNDILALEYLSALIGTDSHIKPLIMKREAPFSAGKSREAIARKEGTDLLMPPYVAEYFKDNPALSINDLGDHIILTLITSEPEEIEGYKGMTFELASKLINAAKECGDIGKLEDTVSDKRYTRARVRRALLSSVLKIAETPSAPPYSLLLGANSAGREYLSRHSAEKTGIYSKRSEIGDPLILIAFDREVKADRLYRCCQMKKGIKPGVFPFIFL